MLSANDKLAWMMTCSLMGKREINFMNAGGGEQAAGAKRSNKTNRVPGTPFLGNSTAREKEAQSRPHINNDHVLESLRYLYLVRNRGSQMVVASRVAPNPSAGSRAPSWR